ncbi:hypothetical protein V1478_009516 [Vespula squamosa]|uniref:Secreted protein n=1 Tax=Vespula squamosa TaxID=30214 RepID=A0ABD2APW3_VESSQ
MCIIACALITVLDYVTSSPHTCHLARGQRVAPSQPVEIIITREGAEEEEESLEGWGNTCKCKIERSMGSSTVNHHLLIELFEYQRFPSHSKAMIALFDTRQVLVENSN